MYTVAFSLLYAQSICECRSRCAIWCNLLVICFPQIRNIPSAYNKPLTGFGSLTAAKYGTRCPAHEYGMSYSCAGHLVPYVAAVKNPYPSFYLICSLFPDVFEAFHVAINQCSIMWHAKPVFGGFTQSLMEIIRYSRIRYARIQSKHFDLVLVGEFRHL